MSKQRFLSITYPHGHTHAGHQQVDLDTETDLAKELFREAVDNKMLIYQIQEDGTTEIVTGFDPAAKRITITPQQAGG